MTGLEFLAIAAEARATKAPIDFSSIPIHTNALVPLTRINPDTGERERALFWRIDDQIHVHPDRWDEFELWVNQPDIADHPDVRALFEEPT